MSKIITLAGQEFVVVAPAFGKLRKIIKAINAMNTDDISQDASMEIAGEIISLITGKSIEEIDSMAIGINEMSAAVKVVPELCGLVSVRAGEAPA